MDSAARLTALAERAALLVEAEMSVGLGSGSTAEAVVRALGGRVATGLQFTAVATSQRTAGLARSFGIALRPLDEVQRLDLGLDGADEIDPNLDLVKGRGGALLWEKLTASICDRFVAVAASEKLVIQLGSRMPLPVEVVPNGWAQTVARIEAVGGTGTLRTLPGSDQPFVSDGGHYVVDLATGPIMDPPSFAYALKAITGVVDHGLFIGFADAALTIDEAGAITQHARPEPEP